jgi:hypothetical protein
MTQQVSRRQFLGGASVSAILSRLWTSPETRSPSAAALGQRQASSKTRIVDVHVHFDDQKANFIPDLLKLSDRLNLTACLLTPFANRNVVADLAKEHPRQIVPFGFVDLDHPDVFKQVEELHTMGYRGLGELEFVKKPYNEPSYFPVYELANLDCAVSHRHCAAEKIRRAGGCRFRTDAPDLFGGDCAAFSEDHRARGALWQSGIRMGGGNRTLELQRFLRPEWVDVDKDACTAHGISEDFLVVGHGMA